MDNPSEAVDLWTLLEQVPNTDHPPAGAYEIARRLQAEAKEAPTHGPLQR